MEEINSSQIPKSLKTFASILLIFFSVAGAAAVKTTPLSLPPAKIITLNESSGTLEKMFGPHQKNILQETVELLRQNPQYTLSIAGHVSASNDSEQDKKTADEIAFYAKNYLLQNGVASKRFDGTTSYGSSKPREEKSKEDANNTRIEIIFDVF
jgi:hypothetical protein